MEAARALATARPTPNCPAVGSPFRTKLPNTPIMMSAAASDHRPRSRSS